MRQRLSARRLLVAAAALLTLVLPACSGDRPADAASAATTEATVGNRYTSVGPVRLADTRSRFGTHAAGPRARQRHGRRAGDRPARGRDSRRRHGRGARRGLRGGRRGVVHHGLALGPAAAPGVQPQRRPRRGRRGQHGHDDGCPPTVGCRSTPTSRPISSSTSTATTPRWPVPSPPAGRSPSRPRRAYDSRSSGGPLASGESRTIGLPPSVVPGDAVAAVLNLTVTETRAAGYWTIFPPGTLGPGGRPLTSNTNASGPGQTVAVQAVVPLGPTAPSRCSPRPAATPSSTCSAT